MATSTSWTVWLPRVERRCVPDEPAVFRLGHMQAEMFDVDGYRGDSHSYYDARQCLSERSDRQEAGHSHHPLDRLPARGHQTGSLLPGIGLPGTSS